VLELRVREPAEALDEEHDRRHARAPDLGRVVQRTAREPMRAARDLADRLVGEADQRLVEEDRLDLPDALPVEVETLLLCESPRRFLCRSEHRGELPRVEMALVEQLLRRLDDRGHDARTADDAAARADGAVAGLSGDPAQ